MKNVILKLLIGVILSHTYVLASEPVPPQIQIETELNGSTLLIQLRNREKLPATIELFSGSLSSLRFSPTRAQIAAGQEVSLKVSVAGDLRGKQVVHLESKIFIDQSIGSLPGPSYYQTYFLEGRTAKKLSYEEAFLSSRERVQGKSETAKIDLGGTAYVSEINRLAFKANPVPSGAKIEPASFRQIQEYTRMNLRQLPKDITLSQGGAPRFMSDFSSTSENLEELTPADQDAFFSRDRADATFMTSAVTIKGHMSLRTGPATYKAAWGWVVRAWQNLGGSWVFLGWTYVNTDGSWQISLSTAAPGTPVRIEYQTKNRFVSIQDAAGNPYTWGDNWPLTGGTTDIGYRYADLTVNGDLPAVDRLYEGATQLWVKFFNNGMNALRDQPIQVFFPNTLASGQCISNDGTGPYAWSCSYWNDGRIYIIPAHGSASVVQHEIAHSINSFYWNGSMPPGAGGSHNLWSCYNNGLALTEGFANFVTYWTQFDRNNTGPSAAYFNMNLEDLPAGVCANQTAEMRVAAAFWDMYDVHSESTGASTADGLYYVNPGVPVSLYLNNKQNAMSDYLPITQAGQSSFWQGEFTKLFRLNKIIP